MSKDPILDQLLALQAEHAKDTAAAAAIVDDYASRLRKADSLDALTAVWVDLQKLPLGEAMDVAEAYAPGDTPVAFDWNAVWSRIYNAWTLRNK